MSGGAIAANKYKSSTYVGLRHSVIAHHALFSYESSMSACENLELHRVSVIIFIVIVFVPYFELANFFKGLLRVATLILVFCMCCL